MNYVELNKGMMLEVQVKRNAKQTLPVMTDGTAIISTQGIDQVLSMNNELELGLYNHMGKTLVIRTSKMMSRGSMGKW